MRCNHGSRSRRRDSLTCTTCSCRVPRARWPRCGAVPTSATSPDCATCCCSSSSRRSGECRFLRAMHRVHYSQVNQYLSGVFYIGSQIAEVSPWYILAGKLQRLSKAFKHTYRRRTVAVSTGDCGTLDLPEDSIDYVFTDPPFGENIYYADPQLPGRVVAPRPHCRRTGGDHRPSQRQDAHRLSARDAALASRSTAAFSSRVAG